MNPRSAFSESLSRDPQQESGPAFASGEPNAEPSTSSHVSTASAGPATPPTSSYKDDGRVSGTLPLPSVLGDFELQEEIACGGMGIIYKAWQISLDRPVAVKTMKAEVLSDPLEAQRFEREMKAVARLRHPNIVPIYEVGRVNGLPYYTMPLLVEGSLSRHRQRLLENPAMAVALMEKVARAVQFAHDNGILHRDLKPSNVLMDARDEPVVSDFGLAKLSDTDVELTRPGVVIGTPAYMSPEQAGGRLRDIGPATDVWALGIMLFELLAGERPFVGESSDEVRINILTEPPRPLRQIKPELAPELEAIILKCLEKDPTERHASAGVLADALAAFLKENQPEQPATGSPSWLRFLRKHPRSAAAGSLLLATVIVLSVLAWQHLTYEPPAPQAPPPPEPIVLIPALGPPEQVRWVIGSATVQSGGLKEPFVVRSEKLAALELLAEPPWPSYRFEAEIRQDAGTKILAGIYVGRRMLKSDKGSHHLLMMLRFGDRGDFAATLSTAVARYDDFAAADFYQQQFPDKFTFPAVDSKTKEMPWRKLTLEVTPTKVCSLLGTDPIVTLSPEEIDGRLELLLKPLKLPNINIQSGGGLGLLLRSGEISCRNAVLKPLP